jgi:ribose/xylose/arabinose/galactoside ABC-type transport system permease subunit
MLLVNAQSRSPEFTTERSARFVGLPVRPVLAPISGAASGLLARFSGWHSKRRIALAGPNLALGLNLVAIVASPAFG